MKNRAILYAILAALCYGVSTPVSKLLLAEIPSTFLAALLYLGAGLSMALLHLFRAKGGQAQEAAITRRELPYTLLMVVLDILAPILLLAGLTRTTSATVSLLNNFEIVATTLLALALFKESVGRRTWGAIALITAASILLCVEDFQQLSFSSGALLVLLACLCWGLENNCTRMLSLKDPLQIVLIKGLGSGLGALGISLMMGERFFQWGLILASLLLGFLAYGLSIYFYILAQRQLGAARTSAYYAFAPFIGTGLSLLLFREPPTLTFLLALLVMILGVYFAATERHRHLHQHLPLSHEHRHRHDDGHHGHTHPNAVAGEHSHLHQHQSMSHAHAHTPDLHHIHAHGSGENGEG